MEKRKRAGRYEGCVHSTYVFLSCSPGCPCAYPFGVGCVDWKCLLFLGLPDTGVPFAAWLRLLQMKT
ncbi:hypothetical protein MPTK1_6g21270 [Marchantia polymorpha subsp. ruderalis]|uniref:Uncharacterized protein n=2 Tax=Marchantia polymorpha TaxID=3197 RepID=A0AAF6BUG4_MARPO|nr:hypothetical protein MARPO_0091s0028 [Marchantia polymorpha]BBN15648.1 hypothetical protein Mp_6g21270 [Marchantia polymorpha subsp. ruderalis]|eukprot:PTQ33166.1 hypothetical protein MARPO_0091s0028 [Marchantia polymorpha]